MPVTYVTSDIDEKRNQSLRNVMLSVNEDLGTTYAFIAKKAGIHTSLISLWKSEHKNFTNKNLDKLEEALRKVAPTYFDD